MLDRTKLLKELIAAGSRIFSDLGEKTHLAEKIWKKISSDSTFQFRTSNTATSLALPVWNGKLDEAQVIQPCVEAYTILACDGSQVYPDRNMPGAGCFLINTGGTIVSYGASSRVTFFSTPYLFLPHEMKIDDAEISFSKDVVDLKREEYEFKDMLAQAGESVNLCLCDGSLIFWHLESKPENLRDYFLTQYCDLLDLFYQRNLYIAGYISAPRSRDLVNLLLFELEQDHENLYATLESDIFARLIDAHIVRFFLQPFMRTNLFESSLPITKAYPPHLKPYFFYIHTGEEIARIEIPAWMAQVPEAVDYIARLILDQSRKGHGYPVCLAEAHEQAVVKNFDRDFFYHALSKMSIDYNRSVLFSQKSLKKRRMNV